MRRIVLACLTLGLLTGCIPVSDPSKWDPKVYCKTVQELFGPDPWCQEHVK